MYYLLIKGLYKPYNLIKTFFFSLQLREDGKGQKKKAQIAETGTASGNNKGKRSRRKTENVSR